jgi:hypothetical protein
MNTSANTHTVALKATSFLEDSLSEGRVYFGRALAAIVAVALMSAGLSTLLH